MKEKKPDPQIKVLEEEVRRWKSIAASMERQRNRALDQVTALESEKILREGKING